MDVLALLDEKKIDYVSKGTDEYAIVCPNGHNHAGGVDSRPSFSINIQKLKGHCLACGFKLNEQGLYKFLVGGEVDELMLQAIGIKSALKRIRGEDEAAGAFLQEAEEFTLLPPGKPWDTDYRGIPAAFYQLVKARHCTAGYFANRIIFPIYINSHLRGFESRDLGKSETLPKYLRSKGFDALHEGLYPYDVVRNMCPSVVILCEGVFDALNATSKGYAALNIFGVRTWSMEKFSLLLATGCREVILLLDNDKAGNEAELILAVKIRDWITVSFANKDLLVDGRDLGDLATEEIGYCINNRRRAVVTNEMLNQLSQYVNVLCAHCGRKYPETVLNIEGVIHHGGRPVCVDTKSCNRVARHKKG